MGAFRELQKKDNDLEYKKNGNRRNAVIDICVKMYLIEKLWERKWKLETHFLYVFGLFSS